MITRERLEELIKQGATVYSEGWGVVFEHQLNKYSHLGIADSKPSLMQTYCDFDDDVKTELIEHLDCLFETKEEAEWYLEFGNITRTESLKLPTWEEFDEKKFVRFVDKNYKQCVLYYLNVANKIFINIGNDEVIDMGILTKDNYIKVCRLAKKLFLGENEDEEENKD